MKTPTSKTSKKKGHLCSLPVVLFWVCVVFSAARFVHLSSRVGIVSVENPEPPRMEFQPLMATTTTIQARLPTTLDRSIPRKFIAPIAGDPKGQLRVPSPLVEVWIHLVQDWNIHSSLELCDSICGSATAWFQIHVAEARKKNKTNPVHCVVPRPDFYAPTSWQIVHDYSKGPWWPSFRRTYDVVFVPARITDSFLLQNDTLFENVVATFRSTAIVILSVSGRRRQNFTSWLEKFQSVGFMLNPALTQSIQKWAVQSLHSPFIKIYNSTMRANIAAHEQFLQVFINPVVASLPKHAHLFMQHGCFERHRKAEEQRRTGLSRIVNRECGTNNQLAESKLPDHFKPVQLTPAMHEKWEIFMLKNPHMRRALLPHEPKPPNITVQRKIPIWKIPNPEPAVPPGFTNSSFWNMIEARAQNKSLLPELVLQRIRPRNYTHPMPIIPVVVWPSVSIGYHTAEQTHIFLDGVVESEYLYMVHNISFYDDPNLIWIGEPGFGWTWEQFCEEFTKVVKLSIVERYKAGFSTRWPIYIPDFTDGQGKQRCLDLERLMGLDLMFYSARSLVQNRYFSSKKKWVLHGIFMGPYPTLFHFGGPYWSKKMDWSAFKNISRDFPVVLKSPKLIRDQVVFPHIPLIVRTDIVRALQNILREQDKQLWDTIEEFERPIDVTHFWPVNAEDRRSATLRCLVSELLDDYGRSLGWKTFIGFSGSAERLGRRQAQVEYLKSMLETKILVVTQRDLWEDHYRLMEAMVSGALVFSDHIVALPRGLQNGTSIILFTSPEDLKSLIVYYLARDKERISIAKRGRQVAFRMHRSWHRMEEIVFGQILTNCSMLPSAQHCPYCVLSSCNASKPD